MDQHHLLKKYWNELFNALKERWPDLTASDLAYISGDWGKLLEMVEKRRHISRKEAISDAEEFISRINVPQSMP